MGSIQNTKLIFVFCLFFLPLQAFAQFDSPTLSPQTSSNETFSPATAFIFGSGDGIYIEVGLWGYISKPGLYKVPHKTDLVSLISLAGGPSPAARMNDIRIIRLVNNADPNSKQERILSVNLEEFIDVGEREKIPVLQPGDVVVVTGSFVVVFSEFVSILRDVALVLNTVLLVSELSKR